MLRMLPLIKNENEGITNNLILILSHKPYRLQHLMINWKLFLRSCSFFNIFQIILNQITFGVLALSRVFACFGKVMYALCFVLVRLFIYISLCWQSHLCIVFCFGEGMQVLCFVLVMSFLHYARFGSVMHALCPVLVRSFMFCALSWRGHLYIVPCFGTVVYALFCVLARACMYCALFWQGHLCIVLCKVISVLCSAQVVIKPEYVFKWVRNCQSS